MSYTTILSVTLNQTPKSLRELRNSHGSAPVIWDALCQKYYGADPHAYGLDGTLEKLWPRYKDLSIPEYQRAVLMMTYDTGYISKNNFKRAASDIRKWLKEFPPKEGYVNHWNEIASFYESDPDHEAIALWHTSVSENPFEGEWDEETEEYDPIDWDEAYEIYEELDNLGK